MFYGEKSEVRNALHLLQREACVYDGNFHKDPPDFCDCKYGYAGNLLKGNSEMSGCPELRTVVELLDKMTEEEYTTILERRQKLKTEAIKIYFDRNLGMEGVYVIEPVGKTYTDITKVEVPLVNKYTSHLTHWLKLFGLDRAPEVNDKELIRRES